MQRQRNSKEHTELEFLRERVISLTFDDGPHPVWTPRIISALSLRAVKATFFILGEAAAHHPALVNLILSEGHSVGIHSWSHRLLFKASRTTIQKEIIQTRDFLLHEFGYSANLFRAPWGVLDMKTRGYLAQEHGIFVTNWDIDAYDYVFDRGRNIVQEIFRSPCHHLTVLFHDGIVLSPLRTRDHTVRMVENITFQIPVRCFVPIEARWGNQKYEAKLTRNLTLLSRLFSRSRIQFCS